MLLTPEQEQQIVEDNMPKIYRAVDNFTARCTSDVVGIPYEDFVQEVTIAFLLYIRRCETPEEMNKFPWYSAMDAMRGMVLRSQPMSCPKSTHSFRAIIHEMPATVSIDMLASSMTEISGLSKRWVDDKETMLDFESFMDEFDENTKRMVSMRYGGMTLRNIASQYGVDKTTIMRRINTLAEKYHEYSDEEDENHE